MSKKDKASKVERQATVSGPEGEKLEFTVSLQQFDGLDAVHPEFTANDYQIDAEEGGVNIVFGYWSRLSRTIQQRIAVWVPMGALAQTVLRDRTKLRPAMQKWAAKPLAARQGGWDEPYSLVRQAYAANAMTVVVSEYGSVLYFYFFSPLRVVRRDPKLSAKHVVEVRMPGEVLSRLWLDLDGILGETPENDEKAEAESEESARAD